VEHADPVREIEDDIHVVLDEEDGEPLPARDLPDDRDGGQRVLRRQTLGRLVEKEERGLLGDGHRDLEEALVAVRQCRRRLCGPGEEAERVEARARPLFARLESGPAADESKVAAAPQLHGDSHVLQHGELREDAGDLEGARDAAPAARGGGERGDVATTKEDAPRGGREETGDEVKQRCLARAVRPDDRADLSRLHREADSGHGLERSEGAPEPASLEERRHARIRSRRAVPTIPSGRKITMRTNTAPVKIIQCSV